MSENDPGDQIPDDELVTRCQSGDRAARAAFYERYSGFVRDIALRHVAEQHADDVQQSVFLKAFEGLNGFHGNSKITTWLHTITERECWRLQRREHGAQRIEHEPVDAARSPAEILEQRETMVHALSRLPSELREAFVLRELVGLKYAEIAPILGISLSQVNERLNEARQRLLRLMNRENSGGTP